MPSFTQRSNAIADVCRLLLAAGPEAARAEIRRIYPFIPTPTVKRSYGPAEATPVFMRDGFIDRYSGDRLIFPPVLRLLSHFLDEDFPYTPAWKTEVTHSAYWEVGATIDHLVPVTLGGADDESNWVTTSMARNYAKMNWRLEDLGWALYPPGSTAEWDGMLGWFLTIAEQHPNLVVKGSLRKWWRAALAAAQ